ncbi:MAG: PilZ domain-containing protein [Planctomycetaceae bacterium]
MTRSAQLSPTQPLATRRIQLEIEQNGRSGTATLRDASPRDLLITSQMALAAETPLLFRMEAGFPLTTIEFSGTVHWMNKATIPVEFGIALKSNAPPELLLNTSGSISRELRYRCRVPGEILIPGQSKPVSALAINYSRAGCCLMSEVELRSGTEVFFIFRNPRHLHRVRLRVRWSSSNNHQFLMGCQNSSRTNSWSMADFDVTKTLAANP